MTGATVLVTDHVFGGLDVERALLEPLGARVVEATDPGDPERLAHEARAAAALLVCYAQVPASVVAASAEGGCRIIARYGIGYDNVDVEAATRAGIVVTNVPDYCLDEVADHTLALLLVLARGVGAADRAVRGGAWELPDRTIHRLRGRRLAVIGVGGIGRRVAARAHAFGLRITGYDPYLDPWDLPDVDRASDLEEAVAEADFISVHAPLTADNRHLVDERTISMMRRAPFVLNTSRGGLVDTEALVRALEDGRVAGVGIDVLEDEPLGADHPLRHHPRAVITPHMGFFSIEAELELQRRVAEEVARALRGELPDRPVNPEVLETRP